MDILKARKKAKAKKGEESPAEPASAPQSAAPPVETEAPPAPEPEEAAAEATPALEAPPPAPVGEMVDLDSIIDEIERDQAERRLKGGKGAEQLQESVADFLATFDGQDYDEEASYRHSFVRADEAENRRERYLNFRLAKEEYGIRLSSVRETIKVPPITKVPLNPPYVAGVISLRGAIIPVIDLRLRLGLPVEMATRKMRIIVAQQENRVVGLLVDEVRDVQDIDREKIEPPPATLNSGEQEFIAGIGHELAPAEGHGRVLILIRLEAIARVERGAA